MFRCIEVFAWKTILSLDYDKNSVLKINKTENPFSPYYPRAIYQAGSRLGGARLFEFFFFFFFLKTWLGSGLRKSAKQIREFTK
jgi:hypothetical protein